MRSGLVVARVHGRDADRSLRSSATAGSTTGGASLGDLASTLLWPGINAAHALE